MEPEEIKDEVMEAPEMEAEVAESEEVSSGSSVEESSN